MHKYKVSDILKLADKKYSLYFDKNNPETQINTYTRHIRDFLKSQGYKKPFNNIEESEAYYLIEHKLKNYFIENSTMPESLKRDKKLAEEIEARNMRSINHYENNQTSGYDDALSQKNLSEVLNSITDNDYNPIDKLRAICNSEDTDLGYQIDNLEKKLSNFKKDYIFYALLKLNNEHFFQAEFIKDYFESYNYLDMTGPSPVPKYGYSKYADKLNNPIKSYIKKNDNH